MRTIILLLAVHAWFSRGLPAQTVTESEGASLFSPLSLSLVADSVVTQDSVSSPMFLPAKRSPSLAMLYSAILPGAGQLYTGRYWKIPIIWGFGIYYGNLWAKYNKLYLQGMIDYRQSYETGAFAGTGDPRLKDIRDFYHDQRDTFIFYFTITYILNIVDAYVGATLFDFDVGEGLDGTPQLKLSVPLR